MSAEGNEVATLSQLKQMPSGGTFTFLGSVLVRSNVAESLSYNGIKNFSVILVMGFYSAGNNNNSYLDSFAIPVIDSLFNRIIYVNGERISYIYLSTNSIKIKKSSSSNITCYVYGIKK